MNTPSTAPASARGNMQCELYQDDVVPSAPRSELELLWHQFDGKTSIDVWNQGIYVKGAAITCLTKAAFFRDSIFEEFKRRAHNTSFVNEFAARAFSANHGLWPRDVHTMAFLGTGWIDMAKHPRVAPENFVRVMPEAIYVKVLRRGANGITADFLPINDVPYDNGVMIPIYAYGTWGQRFINYGPEKLGVELFNHLLQEGSCGGLSGFLKGLPLAIELEDERGETIRAPYYVSKFPDWM